MQKLEKQDGTNLNLNISASKNYLDKYVWKCSNRDCRGIENIRKGNQVFGNFPKIKLRILLIFIFTHFTSMISPTISQKTLRMTPLSIRLLSNYLNSCIVKEQLEEEQRLGQFGGHGQVVEIDESCFFKRKNNTVVRLDFHGSRDFFKTRFLENQTRYFGPKLKN